MKHFLYFGFYTHRERHEQARPDARPGPEHPITPELARGQARFRERVFGMALRPDVRDAMCEMHGTRGYPRAGRGRLPSPWRGSHRALGAIAP